MLVRIIDFFRDRLPLVIRCCCAVLAILVVIDFFVDKHHAHTKVEHLPGFWAVFGFVACVVIILVSKWFGHLGIMTREDYYDD